MRLKAVSFLPSIVWFIIATVLMLMPGEDIPEIGFLDLIYFDKWVHAGLFFGLTFLTAYPFIKTNRSTKKLLTKISIAFFLYGILIELIQKYFASYRSFDLMDILADGFGCLIGYVISNWLVRKLAIKNKPL